MMNDFIRWTFPCLAIVKERYYLNYEFGEENTLPHLKVKKEY